MSYFQVRGALFSGIQAVSVSVECVQTRRLPYIQILGASAGVAGEARERLLAALGTLQGGKFRLPARRITLQVSPNARELALGSLDLAFALSILGSAGQIPLSRLEGALVCGGLGLDGRLEATWQTAVLRPLLKQFSSALLPWEGSEILEEAQLERGGGFRTLPELVGFLRDGAGSGRRRDLARIEAEAPPAHRIWARISGQSEGKRAVEIAAAGAHHLLLPGPPRAHADLLAHALSSLLPPLGEAENEEVRGIYALAGVGEAAPSRPFHAYGSRTSLPAFFRDRRLGKVEETLLAHRGVLFLDRAAERGDDIFPALLQPMIRGTLPARLLGQVREVPACFLVVAASPLCACGAEGDPRTACVCRPTEAKRFATRWRRLAQYPFDLALRISPEAEQDCGETWEVVADRVEKARLRMRQRQGKENGYLRNGEFLSAIPWDPEACRLWNLLERRIFDSRGGPDGLGRVAMTICDLRKGDSLAEIDLLESLHYFAGGEGFSVGPGRERRPSVPLMNSSAIP